MPEIDTEEITGNNIAVYITQQEQTAIETAVLLQHVAVAFTFTAILSLTEPVYDPEHPYDDVDFPYHNNHEGVKHEKE